MNIEESQEIILQKTAESLHRIVALQNEKEEMSKAHEKEVDDIFVEFLNVIDTFEKAEKSIQERGLDQDENALKAIKRLLNAKKKALFVLEKFNVKMIEFKDNMAIDELCSTVDTEADSTKDNGEIISIERNGYTRNGHVIRTAEVVIVKN